MITPFQAIILGLIQGASELFPVSSLGHGVLAPAIFGWNIANANDFLIFLVATHLATALVLIAFFMKDWLLVIQGILRSLWMRRIHPDDTYAKLGWLLVVATIPAGILGLFLEKKLTNLFVMPAVVAAVLVLNGVML